MYVGFALTQSRGMSSSKYLVIVVVANIYFIDFRKKENPLCTTVGKLVRIIK